MPSYKYRNASGATRWRCAFYFQDYTGKRIKKKKEGFSTKREADAWERDFLAKKSGSPSMTFRQLAENYLDDIRRRLKPITVYQAKLDIRKHLLPTFGDMPINEISAGSVRAWENDLHDKGLTVHSVTQLHVRLSAMMNFAIRLYDLPSNPVRKAGPFRMQRAEVTEKKTPCFWTVEQFDTFITSGLPPEGITLFSVLFWTGCRIGEALALRRGDVDVEAGTLRITKDISVVPPSVRLAQAPKTPASRRTIAIPPHLVAILDDWIKQTDAQDDADMLFSFRATCTWRCVLQERAAKLGLPRIRVHDLRHSHASLLVELGFPPIVIRDRLGHRDIQTTMNIYSHLYPSKQKTIADALGNAH